MITKQSEKPCLGCGLTDPPSGFRMRRVRSGARTWYNYPASRCRACEKIQAEEHRRLIRDGLVRVIKRSGLTGLDPEEWRAYWRIYGKKAYKLHRDEYRLYHSNFRKTHPVEVVAYRLVHKALRSGALIPKSCELCGSKRAYAHHDDYAKPLEVRWLCQSCHRTWHYSHPVNKDAKPPP